MQLPGRDGPRSGLQICNTRVDFPVPVQSGGRFIIFPLLTECTIAYV